MKFYEIDLTQILPYGIPVNSNSHVESTGYINEFFIKGFENYFKKLFVVDDEGNLNTDYSRSCSSPVTEETCAFCTDDQLRDAITEAGFIFYSANDHIINAKFLHDISTISFGSERYLTSVAQYIANTNLVEASATYNNENPYRYSINFTGDITSSENVETITERMIENLKIVGTAHTLCTDFIFEDTGSEIEGYAGVTADDVTHEYDIDLKLPREDTSIISDFLSSTFTSNATLTDLPLKGSVQLPRTYIATNTARYQLYEFIYLCPPIYNSSKPYPLMGYSDLYLYYYSSSRSYLCDERLLMPQEISTETGNIKVFRIMENIFNGRSYTELKKEKIYNNLGIRQQVFSVITNGYKRYLDAHLLFTEAKTPVMSDNDLAQNGYFKDKHFYAFTETSGLPIQISSTPTLLYYKNNSSSSPSPVDHPFLYDDAYTYEIQGVYRSSGQEELGDVFSSTVSEVIEDDNGNPIDFTAFVVSFDSNHNLQLSYPSTISDIVFIRFSIQQKPTCLVMYPSGSGSLTGVSSSSGSGLFKILGASKQPNTASTTGYFGTGMTAFGVYSCSDSTFKPSFFKNVTEAQAFLGFCNSDTLFTFNSNIQTYVEGSLTVIKSTSGSIQRCAFVSCAFESLHYETITLNWNNPHENRLKSINFTDAQCFGTNRRYATATTYVVDEINGDPLLSSLVTVKVRGEFNSTPTYLDLEYHGDSSISKITSIKIHGSYPDD